MHSPEWGTPIVPVMPISRRMAAEVGQSTRIATERQAAARQEKLAEIEEQRLSGQLVIRKMTSVERAIWVKRRRVFAATSTAKERASRASALETRRRQAERLRD